MATFMAEDGSIVDNVEITYADPYGKLVYYIDKNGSKRRTLASYETLSRASRNLIANNN